MNLRCPKPIFQLFRKISERRPQTFHTTSFVPLLRIKFISYNNNLANGSDQMLKIRKKYFFFPPNFSKEPNWIVRSNGGGANCAFISSQITRSFKSNIKKMNPGFQCPEWRRIFFSRFYSISPIIIWIRFYFLKIKRCPYTFIKNGKLKWLYGNYFKRLKYSFLNKKKHKKNTKCVAN